MTAQRDLSAIDHDIAETETALAEARGNKTEVYARIVGYYRSVRNWNKGKRDEFNHRNMFALNAAESTENGNVAVGESMPMTFGGGKNNADSGLAKNAPSLQSGLRYELYARKTCPNCQPIKTYLAHSGLSGASVDVDTLEGAAQASAHRVFAAPTVILYDAFENESARVQSAAELARALEAEALAS
ncbi:anaerobic ribonucleoside-triphosphate reductase [Treponema endosymbiont of Eucomonympha sp.]|uniref:anaerobic ribonucleoside-triphosphate reductase n=1 Tax=Treponema endosymbiont of Eucomonympha sp. TaxID=1580831 RepID=UPI00075199E6|nr:anaerobic ribonucleoside-triphosphate reductase [Treponema endosymbiont of Eucomonympha sp.]